MSSKIKRFIAVGLGQFAWPNQRHDNLTQLVLSYCYRDLPYAVVLPVTAIKWVSFAPSVERIFVVADNGEILVLTEDWVLLGSIVPRDAGILVSHASFDPKHNVLMALSFPSKRVLAIDMDGARRHDLDLAAERVSSMWIDACGERYVMEQVPAAGFRLVCGLHEVILRDCAAYCWDVFQHGIVLATQDRTNKLWTTSTYDSQLRATRYMTDSAYVPIGFDPDSKTVIVERENNCVLEAIASDDSRARFRCPDVYSGPKGGRDIANLSWGSAIRTMDGNQVTMTQLRLEPVPPIFVLHRLT